MNKKGFISISVVYTLFILFLMLLLSVLTGYVTNRILLKTAKGDTTEILINSEDNRQLNVVCRNQRLSTCFMEHYNLDKSLIYHDNDPIDSESALEASDKAYRYVGANPFNYVCFGSDAEVCPAENLYRIIGIYNNQVKLIKNQGLGAKQWNNTAMNYWRDSSLYEYLNNAFLNSFNDFWQQKIVKTTWNIGGVTYNIGLSSNALTAYNQEISNLVTVNAKIGLMYLSDYYYAATPEYWTYKGLDNGGADYRLSKAANWLAGNNEFILANNQDNLTQAYRTFTAGFVGVETVTTSLDVRPTFYLYPQVKLIDGLGTVSDPLRVA